MKWPLRNGGVTYPLSHRRHWYCTECTLQWQSVCSIHATILAQASTLQLEACRALFYSTTTFYTERDKESWHLRIKRNPNIHCPGRNKLPRQSIASLPTKRAVKRCPTSQSSCQMLSYGPMLWESNHGSVKILAYKQTRYTFDQILLVWYYWHWHNFKSKTIFLINYTSNGSHPLKWIFLHFRTICQCLSWGRYTANLNT